MCGIFAYLNHLVPRKREEIYEILFKGLERLEYRGYDSAGVGVDGEFNEVGEVQIQLIKSKGKVAFLRAKAETCQLDKEEAFQCHLGIAHTRWATHGEPSDINSHPQPSGPDCQFAVVHNGIITNYRELKTYLEAKGYKFFSDTDTEVIAKLIQLHFDLDVKRQLTFRNIVEAALQQLEGAFAIVVKSVAFPNEAVACRRGSPLLIGIKAAGGLSTNTLKVVDVDADGLEEDANNSVSIANPVANSVGMSSGNLPRNISKSGRLSSMVNLNLSSEGLNAIEYFLASDASAIVDHTRRVIYLEDNDVAHICMGEIAIHRMKINTSLELYQNPEIHAKSTREITHLEMEIHQLMRGNYDHYMMKEIYEQPDALENTMRGRVRYSEDPNIPHLVNLGGLRSYMDSIKRSRRLIFLACGTSYHSCLAARAFLEEMTLMPVDIELASDFMDRECPIFRDDCCFFVSQSGETADTLNTLRYCKSRGSLIVGIVNTVGSTISRESHCGVHLNIGPEIGVASTKAYTAQIMCLLMFAIMMASDRVSMQKRIQTVIEEFRVLGPKVKEVLDCNEDIIKLTEELHDQRSLLVMGRGYQYATCLEGALKIKELTYMHSEGILSGELKHGPLALIDEQMPVIMIVIKDKTYKKSLNALQQVSARKGRPIVICTPEVVDEVREFSYKVVVIPSTIDCVQPILTTIPLQLLSYHIAVKRGHNVDFPRNLAKSVTVE